VKRVLNLAAGAAEALACVCFAGFVLSILAQIVYRYAGLTIIFSEELARLLNIYVVFIGVIAIMRYDGDIRVDILDRWIGDRSGLMRAVRTVYKLLALVFLLIVAAGSWQLMMNGWPYRLATMAWLNQGHIYLAPFLGSALGALVMLLRVVDVRGTLDEARKD